MQRIQDSNASNDDTESRQGTLKDMQSEGKEPLFSSKVGQ